VIAPPNVAARPHRIWLQRPGPLVDTPDGGWEQSWIDLAPPRMWSKIETASAVDLQRVFADSTIIATASHVVKLPFHAGLTTTVRILFDGRSFMVTGVADTDQRKVESVVACTEVVV
jgi:head-tail adaptor